MSRLTPGALKTILSQVKGMFEKGGDSEDRIQPQNDAHTWRSISKIPAGYTYMIMTILFFNIATLIALVGTYMATPRFADWAYSVYYITASDSGFRLESTSRYNMGVVLIVASALSTIGLIFELLFSSYVISDMRKRRNSIRWFFASLSEPALATTLWFSMANFDLYSLVANFALAHIATLTGLLQEQENAPTIDGPRAAKPTYLPLTVASWIGLLSLVPIMVFLIQSNDLNEQAAVVWIAFAIYLANRLVGGWIQYTFYNFTSTPGKKSWFFSGSDDAVSNYVRYEVISRFTTTLAFLAVTWLLFGAAFSDEYSVSNDYIDTFDLPATANNTGIVITPDSVANAIKNHLTLPSTINQPMSSTRIGFPGQASNLLHSVLCHASSSPYLKYFHAIPLNY